MARRVCLAFLLALFWLLPSLADAQSTRLTGAVTIGWEAVTNQQVMAFEPATGWSFYSQTDSSGLYEFLNLPYGSYRVQTIPDDRDYVGQFYIGADYFTGATLVPLTAQTPVATGIDFSLVRGSRVSGRTWHDKDGDRQFDVGEDLVSPVLMDVSTSDRTNTVMQVWTNPDGTYVVHGVPNTVQGVRSYVVSAIPAAHPPYGTSPYGLQYYDGVTVRNQSTTLGQDTLPRSGIDFPLVLGATISGMVRNTAGQPLSGIQICANDDGVDWSRCATSRQSGSGIAAGSYDITGLGPGRYWLFASNTTQVGYWGQLYYHQLSVGFSRTGGTPIDVGVGQAVSGRDFDLVPAGGSAITGRVTDANGNPLAGIDLYAKTATGPSSTFVTTNSSGYYQLIGLQAATYYVFTSNTFHRNLVNQLYRNVDTGCAGCRLSEGTSTVLMGTGDVAEGRDFQLHTGGRITGRVTLAGTPSREVVVKALNQYGNEVGGAAIPNSDGTYEIKGLPTDIYQVRTYGGAALGYLDEVYDNVPCASCSPTAGGRVPVTVTQTTEDINFDLAKAPVNPVMSTVQPTAGPVAGGQSVTVTGSGFQAGAVVTFGGTPGTVLTMTLTVIQVMTPGHLSGSVDVRVVNPDNGASTKVSAYSYVAGPQRYVATTGWDTQGNLSNDCAYALSPCRSIRQAINRAATGDTVFVASGTYAEAGVNLSRRLTIVGRYAGVSPNDAVNPLLPNAVRVRADESVFEGQLQLVTGSAGTIVDGMLFMARTASTFNESAVLARLGQDVDDVAVRNTVFLAVRGSAVNVGSQNHERWTVEGNRVEGIDPRTSPFYPAFNFQGEVAGSSGPADVVVSGNTIVGNGSAQQGGIALDGVTRATISGNTVTTLASTTDAIRVTRGSAATVTGNTVSTARYGVYVTAGGDGIAVAHNVVSAVAFGVFVSAGGSSIDVSHNAVSTSGTGIQLAAQSNVLAVGSIRITNNSVSDVSGTQILFAFTPLAGSTVTGVAIADNAVTMNAAKLTLAFAGVDLRLSANAIYRDVSVTGNRVTVTGSFPGAANPAVTAGHAVKVRGNIPGSSDGSNGLRISDNLLVNLSSGSTPQASPPGPPASGVFLETSAGSSWPVPPTSAVVTVTCNTLRGFANGVSVYNSDSLSQPTYPNARYGGLTDGATVTLRDNDFDGSTATGVRTGTGAEPWIDAVLNWWGAAGPAVSGNAYASPPLPVRPMCGDSGAALDTLRQRILDLAAAATDAKDRTKLEDAALHLLESQDPSLWSPTDPWVLDARKGNAVFQFHKDALIDLVHVLDHAMGAIDSGALQTVIDEIGGVDGKLAAVAVSRADARKPKQVAKALDEMAKGSDRLALEQYESAVEHFRNAWQHAQKG